MPGVTELLQDEAFTGLPLEEQRKVLLDVDPDFAGLPPEEQTKVLSPSDATTREPETTTSSSSTTTTTSTRGPGPLAGLGPEPEQPEGPGLRQLAAEQGAPRSAWLRPTGQVVGGALGAALTAPGALGLGPAAPVAGAGLGAAAGGSAVDALERIMGRQVDTEGTAGILERGLEDVNTGMAGEIGGQGLTRGAGAVARATGLSRVLPAAGRRIRMLAEAYGIPMSAADLSNNKWIARLENIPNYFTFGSGRTQAFREGQLAAAGEATAATVDRLAQQHADEMTAGIVGQHGLRTARQHFRADAEGLFTEVEQLAGNEPVVPTTRLRAMAARTMREAREAPYEAPAGTGKIAGVGEDVYVTPDAPTGRGAPRPTPPRPGATGATPAQEGASASATIDRPPGVYPPGIETTAMSPRGGPMAEHVFQGEDLGAPPPDLESDIYDAVSRPFMTFRQARRIESQLGEMGYRRGAPIGTIREGQAKALYSSVRGDIDEYLTTPAGAEVAPRLAEAKQQYATGVQLFNRSINSTLAKRGAKPEELVGKVFRPGQTSDLLDYRQAVDPDTYEAAVSAWLRKMGDDAFFEHGGNRLFRPSAFTKQVRKFDRVDQGVNQLDAMLGPERADELRNLTSVLERTATAEKIAGNPSGTAQGVLSADQVMRLMRLGLQAATGSAGAAAAGVPGAVAGLVGPGAIGQLTTRGPGIRLLSEGLHGGRMTDEGARLLAQIMAVQTGGRLRPREENRR